MSWEQVGIIYELMLIIVLLSNKKWATRFFLGNIGLLIPFYGGALFAGLFYITGYGATSLRILLLTILIGTNLWASKWAKRLRLRKRMDKGILLSPKGLRVSILILGLDLGITLFIPEWTMALFWAYFFGLLCYLFYEDMQQKKLFFWFFLIYFTTKRMAEEEVKGIDEVSMEKQMANRYRFLQVMLSYYFSRWPCHVDFREKKILLLAMYFYIVIQRSEMEEATQEEKAHFTRFLFILNAYYVQWSPYEDKESVPMLATKV